MIIKVTHFIWIQYGGSTFHICKFNNGSTVHIFSYDESTSQDVQQVVGGHPALTEGLKTRIFLIRRQIMRQTIQFSKYSTFWHREIVLHTLNKKMKTIAVQNSGFWMFPKLMSKYKRNKHKNKTQTQKDHCQDVIRVQEDRNTDKDKIEWSIYNRKICAALFGYWR